MKRRSFPATLETTCAAFAKECDLPDCLRAHSAFRAMGTLAAIATDGLDVQAITGSVKACVSLAGLIDPDTHMQNLLSTFAGHIAEPLLGTYASEFSLRGWLDAAGYDDFIAQTIRIRMPDANRARLLDTIGHAINRLHEMVTQAQDDHARRIMRRDAATAADAGITRYDRHLPWLLAADHDEAPDRSVIIARRLQAITIYGAVANLLHRPDITQVIDGGAPLGPHLVASLDLPGASVRSLVHARPLNDTLTSHDDWQNALRALREHEVPLAEWPGAGLPHQPGPWMRSRWIGESGRPITCSTLIRADYHGTDPSQVRDAVEAFRIDLLQPLLAAQIARRGSGAEPMLRRLQGDMEHMWSTRGEETTGAARRTFLRVVRQALIGSRRPKSFQEAVAKWHRYAATVAAMRDEAQADKPGWPALCAPWRSRCGRYEIVPLTSAAELVAEGQAHQHCVGGYYATCRVGDTQILSLRASDKPAATVEVLLGNDWQHPHLTIGQFKGWHNQRPPEECHRVLRGFLDDLRTGHHPVELRSLRVYRKWAHAHAAPWSPAALPLTHARAVYPLYRVLLAKPTPGDFDEWVDTSGLAHGLSTLIDDIISADAISASRRPTAA